MDRLTGDFKGVSMFLNSQDAKIYNRLREYEDTGLTPGEVNDLCKERKRMQPMDELINLAELQNYPLRRGNPGCDEVNANPHFLNGIESIIEFAEDLPTIDPVRHGRWARDDTFRDLYFCDQCLAGEYRETKFKYCPDCGARMDDDESDGRTSERTLDNCRMMKRHGKPEQNRAAVTCLGFGRAEYDDEPCDTCKQCPLQRCGRSSQRRCW